MSSGMTNWSNYRPEPTPLSSRGMDPAPPPPYVSAVPPKSPIKSYAPPSPAPTPNPQFYQPLPQYAGQQNYHMAPAAFNANHHSVQVVQMMNPNLGSRSCRVTCRHCKADVETKIDYETGRMTHLIAMFLCCVGCICCVCLPYCSNEFKDATHICPNCNQVIGSYRR